MAAASSTSQRSGPPCLVSVITSSTNRLALAKYRLVPNRYTTSPGTVRAPGSTGAVIQCPAADLTST